MSEIFIRRPVATVLLTLCLLLFGLMSAFQMPINNLPNVEYPTIRISAALPGANSETMAASVALPLEKQFSQIDGVDSMLSSSTQGNTTITIVFSLSRDIDAAAQDVNAAISAAAKQLPPGMTSPPSLKKINPSEQPVMYLSFSSNSIPLPDIYKYIDTYVSGTVASMPGVSEVNVYGGKKPAVRIKINPFKTAGLGIGTADITTATAGTNVNSPAGTQNGTNYIFDIDANDSLQNAKQFGQVVVAATAAGNTKLSDVATVKDSVENENSVIRFATKNNVTPGIMVAISKQPGANIVQVADEVNAKLPEIRRNIPQAILIDTLNDQSLFVRDSVRDVFNTLILALLLVVAVVFVFLGQARATLIPAIAAPLSLIGTFSVMYACGFSLNNLSLMALTLAVGFVVDDAIVVMENIFRRIELGENVLDASIRGSKEIFSTVVTMTVSLVVVFLPIMLMSGIVGRLFREFAISIGVAILISGALSLMLTPMMCNRILKAGHQQPTRLQKWFDSIFDRTVAFYGRMLTVTLNRKRSVMVFVVLVCIGTGLIATFIGKGFIPTQDQSFFMINIKAPEWTSYDYIDKHVQAVADIVRKNDDVDKISMVSGNGDPTSGQIMVRLKSLDQRKHSVDDIIKQLRPQLANVAGVRAIPINPPSIPTGGRSSPTTGQFTLYCPDLNQLYKATTDMQKAMSELPSVTDIDSDLQLRQPKLQVQIDYEKTAAVKLTVKQVMDALYSAFGPKYLTQIYAPSDEYNVYLEADNALQNDPRLLENIYIKNSNGDMIPILAVATVNNVTAAISVNHVGQLPSCTIFFNSTKGQDVSGALNDISALAAKTIPVAVGWRFEGDSGSFLSSFSNLGILLLITIFIIYVVLGILYESYIHPLTILTALPLAGFGALLSLWICGKTLDIYAYVGIIMLVGLVKKNGIMMVDFAVQLEKENNLSPHESIYQACMIRFRPIMMTTMAALLGSLPLAFGLGAGGDARQTMGIAVVGGLLFSQVFTLLITPVFYLVFDKLQQRLNRKN
ncbi:MAG: efflux RND transporter permease subunit [Negativicutes bacterium]|jgi:HAE1 family hydrophobic/amphiphilic exporter-1